MKLANLPLWKRMAVGYVVVGVLGTDLWSSWRRRNLFIGAIADQTLGASLEHRRRGDECGDQHSGTDHLKLRDHP